ncbi:NF038130 family PEP-CTERM protein [Phormidium yuhuli AB48]|uniref:NF038130 family PEP-CTERM protein n=1 Tax=Phormidium yuhuli AB48 TaxID=2940671 RepID=A0ABY5AV86_9CYAN|nr:NF038130 family PEP-CTERM protein [Phormidium yuhuli]USR92770.1 NF038130 family PEP-CTERM protein [Phormidium yuhuli AB48]
MSGLLHKTLIGSSFIGITVLAGSPAMAGSLTNISLTGQALFYEQVGSSTVRTDNPDLAVLLQGDINNPGGHIELSGTDRHSGAANFRSATTLSGTLNGEAISVSSLTQADWLTSYGGYNTFAQKWLTEAWDVPGFSSFIGQKVPALAGIDHISSLNSSQWSGVVLGFVTLAAFQNDGASRFSDPNVNYVRLENNGDVAVGLAGHLNHSTGLNMSEVVRVDYGGQTHFLYQMGQALESGLVNDQGQGADGVSHTGLYHLTIPGNRPGEPIPEPSTVLGLLSIAGLGLMKRRQS